MTTRLPPSAKPPETRSLDAPRRGTRVAADDAPRLIKREEDEAKSMSPEAALWGGVDMDRSLEIRKADVDQRMGEAAAAEKADKEEGAEHASDARDEAEKSAKSKGLLKIFSWQKNTAKPDPKAQLLKNEQARQQAMKGNAPAFTKQGQSSTAASSSRLPMVAARPLTSASASRLNAVGGVQQALMGAPARAERPPDAYALLKDAKERGQLFVEDALAEGHSEDQEDPELADAVEECIRMCFGVRGILRIGPGKNDKNEAIIVVATTNGFSEASLAVVPPKVHRFNTLIAIPFELLPLKRER